MIFHKPHYQSPKRTWREIIARYVAWKAVRYLYQILFADVPPPEAVALLPAELNEEPSATLDRQKAFGNKTRLVLLCSRQTPHSRVR